MDYHLYSTSFNTVSISFTEEIAYPSQSSGLLYDEFSVLSWISTPAIPASLSPTRYSRLSSTKIHSQGLAFIFSAAKRKIFGSGFFIPTEHENIGPCIVDASGESSQSNVTSSEQLLRRPRIYSLSRRFDKAFSVAAEGFSLELTPSANIFMHLLDCTSVVSISILWQTRFMQSALFICPRHTIVGILQLEIYKPLLLR